MAHIIYDNDQPTRYYNTDQRAHSGSAGYYGPRSNGSAILLAIVILLILFFWADLRGQRNNFDAEPRDSSNSMIRSITQTRYVIADNLNMREQPSIDAQASYSLPRGTQVALLGESHQGFDGDVWQKVRVETFEGTHVGWVSQRYVE